MKIAFKGFLLEGSSGDSENLVIYFLLALCKFRNLEDSKWGGGGKQNMNLVCREMFKTEASAFVFNLKP